MASPGRLPGCRQVTRRTYQVVARWRPPVCTVATRLCGGPARWWSGGVPRTARSSPVGLPRPARSSRSQRQVASPGPPGRRQDAQVAPQDDCQVVAILFCRSDNHQQRCVAAAGCWMVYTDHTLLMPPYTRHTLHTLHTLQTLQTKLADNAPPPTIATTTTYSPHLRVHAPGFASQRASILAEVVMGYLGPPVLPH